MAPAGHLPGQLLHHQLGDVAAAVPAHVEDQSLARHLGAQVAVEVRPALAHHVRDVQVAEPSVAELADQLAPGRPPSPGSAAAGPSAAARPRRVVPRRRTAGGRSARRACRAVPASSGQGPRAESTGCPSTATSSSPGPTAAPGAASGERARGSDDSPGSTRSTSQRPAASREMSAPSWPTGVWFRVPFAGRGHVGVRRAELADHLPEQVGEVGRARGSGPAAAGTRRARRPSPRRTCRGSRSPGA